MISSNGTFLGLKEYKSGHINTAVGVGETNNDIIITPPEGEIWSLDSWYIYLTAPSTGSSTSGTYGLYVLAFGITKYSSDFSITQNWNGESSLRLGKKTGTTDPTSITDIITAMQAVRFSSNSPLIMLYENLTDATVTCNRDYNFMFRRYKRVD